MSHQHYRRMHSDTIDELAELQKSMDGAAAPELNQAAPVQSIKNAFVFVAADGDGIGAKVARASLADDVEGLHSVSAHIEAGNEVIKDFAVKNGGQVISGGGDEANIRIPLESVELLESLRVDYSYVVGATLSLGVGESLSQASKSLMIAKLKGKNQILQYSPEVEQEWVQASQSANDGTATGEAKKIGDAYMKNDKQVPAEAPVDPSAVQAAPAGVDAPAPEAATDDHSDCPYCVQDNQELSAEDDCPYCVDDAQPQATDDCPYCAEPHAEDQHQHDDNCSHCQELDAANAQVQPEAAPTGQEVAPENTPVDSAAPIATEQAPIEPGSEEHKSPQEIMGEFDEVHGGEDPSQEGQTEVEQIDDTGIAEGNDRQENNVSRPGDYDGVIPQGAEDPNNTDGSQQQDPNYAGLLQDDLNNNADDIGRQKVGDTVRQALQAFKANKAFLEQAQQQAPEFYMSNILMLKAMIEMAKLLGFNGPAAMPQDGQPELGQQQADMVDGQPDPSNPFPQHPDHGADPAQDPAAAAAGGGQSDWANPFPQHADHGGDPAGKPQAQ